MRATTAAASCTTSVAVAIHVPAASPAVPVIVAAAIPSVLNTLASFIMFTPVVASKFIHPVIYQEGVLYRPSHCLCVARPLLVTNGGVGALGVPLVRELDIGSAVRTVKQATQLATRDASIFTSLTEGRFLAGSIGLFQSFAEGLLRATRRNRKSLIARIERARAAERAQYGETVYLLEPNVKKSRGCLRDIQLLRWIGFVRHETVELQELHLLGLLSADDFQGLQNATEFLLRVRNELHFHAPDTIFRPNILDGLENPVFQLAVIHL